MKLQQIGRLEVISWERAGKDIPELFGVEGGTGYTYVSQMGHSLLGPGHKFSRAGSEGFGNCVALLVQRPDGKLLTHVDPGAGYEVQTLPDCSNGTDALIIRGELWGNLATRVAMDLMEVAGYTASTQFKLEPNINRGFSLFVDIASDQLAILNKDVEPIITRYDLNS